MSERVALIIGNGNYKFASKLPNAMNDADDIEARLKRFGFVTQLVTNATHEQLDRSLETFRPQLDEAEVALVFFAGHGLQIKDENYLIAIDSNFKDEVTAKHSSLSLNLVIDMLEHGQATTNIVMLDACRNNPYRAGWVRASAQRGLAPVYVPKGTLIAYATSPGQFAYEGSGRNGEYTAALLQHIDAVDCSIESMLKRVRNTLSAATGGKQVSWEHTSLAGEFYFNRSVGLKVGLYSQTALRDRLFVLKEEKKSHELIAKLKIYDYYTQNPALQAFEAEDFARVTKNTLFVVGRNIYQAACGGARAASKFISDFPQLAQRLPHEKWRALLDGMLFEVYFNSNGDLRKEFKIRRLDVLFALQEFDGLDESFQFIAGCLRANPEAFHVIPGVNREVAMDAVVKKRTDGSYLLREIRLSGKNILRVVDGDGDDINPPDHRLRSKDRERFETELLEMLGIPKRLLKLSYPGARTAPEELAVPFGWTVARV